MYEEGDIADGPNGPLIFQGGQWVPMQANPNVIPPNPLRVAQEQAQVARQAASDQREQVRFEERNRPNLPAGYQLGPDGVAQRIPGLPDSATEAGNPEMTATTRANAINAFTATRQLDTLIADIERKFRAGPGSTKGIYGAQDYLPTPTNRRFDEAGNAVRGAAITALGFTSGQTNTAREVEMNIGPYIPAAGDYDDVILDKIQRLKELRDRARVQATTILGGVPNASGRITPVDQLSREDRERLFPAGTLQPGIGGGPDLPSGGGASGQSGPVNPTNPGGMPRLGAGEQVVFGGDQAPIIGDRLSSPQEQDIAQAIRQGDRGQALALLQRYSGAAPTQDTIRSVEQAIDYARKNPSESVSFGYGQGDQRAQQQADFERYGNYLAPEIAERQQGGVTGQIGSGARGVANSLTLGAAPYIAAGAQSLFGDETFSDRLQRARATMEADRRVNPLTTLAGEVGGGAFSALGLEATLARAGAGAGRFSGLLSSPRTADAIYGGVYAGLESGGDAGATTAGSAAGLAGGMFGRALSRPLAAGARGLNSAARRGINAFGGGVALNPTQVGNSGERAILNAARNDLTGIESGLREAAQLGVPATPADFSPGLRSLAGAAVRRSDDAARLAEDALIPRAREQIDRLGQAVERNLGPIANIPALSQRLSQQAQEAAAPLYREAYATPVPSTPEISSLLGTPFGRQALGRARTIAANERRNPETLGFALDDAGNPILNPVPINEHGALAAARSEYDNAALELRREQTKLVPQNLRGLQERVRNAEETLNSAQMALSSTPSPDAVNTSIPGYTTQTLDYVKRGMDDVLEQYRNPITNRLNLDEAGRAQNAVLRGLLSEVDALNPAYGRARAAYAGPAQSKDALMRGGDAFSLNPDLLQMQVSGQSGEQLAQMQAGYRSALMQAAERARYNTNPFEATLGTRTAERRLSTLYPESSGVADLLRQRDLEAQLARTNNSILGNSATAGRQIADENFASSPVAQGAADIGAAAITGGVPVATMLRTAANSGLRDAFKLGVGKRATRKADEIAPILFNTDPSQSLSAIRSLADRDQAYRDFVSRYQRGGRVIGGMFGAPLALPFVTQ